MIADVLKSEADSLGFDLGLAVEAYRTALTKHATSQGVAAPVAHPLVEGIVKHRDGFRIIDDTPPPPLPPVQPLPTPDEQRGMKLFALGAEERERMDAIMSPARRQLAMMEMAELQAKPNRSAAEDRALAAIEALFLQIQSVVRRRLQLSVELEELPEARVAAWSPAWEA